MAQKSLLLQTVRAKARLRRLSRRTERTYVGWIRRFIRYTGLRHPRELGEREVAAFLTYLAAEQWAQSRARVPVVLTRQEVEAVLAGLTGVPRLVALLLYGGGLRLLECLQLRVKDVDLERGEIRVRDTKGGKPRVTVLPEALRRPLGVHIAAVRRRHDADLAVGAGAVALPGALAVKYPGAAREWVWQWVFPAGRWYIDRVSGERRRHHLHETVVQRAMKAAVLRSGIGKRASCHTLRHSFATHSPPGGPMTSLALRWPGATLAVATEVQVRRTSQHLVR